MKTTSSHKCAYICGLWYYTRRGYLLPLNSFYHLTKIYPMSLYDTRFLYCLQSPTIILKGRKDMYLIIQITVQVLKYRSMFFTTMKSGGQHLSCHIKEICRWENVSRTCNVLKLIVQQQGVGSVDNKLHYRPQWIYNLKLVILIKVRTWHNLVCCKLPIRHPHGRLHICGLGV